MDLSIKINKITIILHRTTQDSKKFLDELPQNLRTEVRKLIKI